MVNEIEFQPPEEEQPTTPEPTEETEETREGGEGEVSA